MRQDRYLGIGRFGRLAAHDDIYVCRRYPCDKEIALVLNRGKKAKEVELAISKDRYVDLIIGRFSKQGQPGTEQP